MSNDRIYTNRRGFTIIEILLVITIIGIALAVIIPRAWRANVNAKYTIVRQMATELGNWGNEWAKRQLEQQGNTDTCLLNNFIVSLSGTTANNQDGYIGDTGNTNWVDPPVRAVACSTPGLTGGVQSIIPVQHEHRNPFNGVSYFNPSNNGTTTDAGQLRLTTIQDGAGDNWYYFVFTGTDTTAVNMFHAGMGQLPGGMTLDNLRNGVFMARLR